MFFVLCNILEPFHEKFPLNAGGTHCPLPCLPLRPGQPEPLLGLPSPRSFSGHLPTTPFPKGQAQLRPMFSLPNPNTLPLIPGSQKFSPQIYSNHASRPCSGPFEDLSWGLGALGTGKEHPQGSDAAGSFHVSARLLFFPGGAPFGKRIGGR